MTDRVAIWREIQDVLGSRSSLPQPNWTAGELAETLAEYTQEPWSKDKAYAFAKRRWELGIFDSAIATVQGRSCRVFWRKQLGGGL